MTSTGTSLGATSGPGGSCTLARKGTLPGYRIEELIVALNDVGYRGPLSVEWEDSRMDRVHGATESAAFCKRLDFEPAQGAFDAVFDKKKQAT